MKKLFLLSACLSALTSMPVLAQTGPDVVVMQTYYRGLNTLHIAISRGEGKTEDIVVKLTNKTPNVQVETYQKVIAKLYQEGYAIKSSFSSGTSSLSTLVFSKGK